MENPETPRTADGPKTMPTLDEQQQQALADLYVQHGAHIQAAIRHMLAGTLHHQQAQQLAPDISHIVFCNIATLLSETESISVVPDTGPDKDKNTLRYLMTAAHHTVIDYFRKKSSAETSLDGIVAADPSKEPFAPPASNPDSFENTTGDTINAALRMVSSRHGESYATMIQLVDIEGRTVNEASAILGIAKGAALQRHARAVRYFREAYDSLERS